VVWPEFHRVRPCCILTMMPYLWFMCVCVCANSNVALPPLRRLADAGSSSTSLEGALRSVRRLDAILGLHSRRGGARGGARGADRGAECAKADPIIGYFGHPGHIRLSRDIRSVPGPQSVPGVFQV
jgi:hypothetical protein